MDLCRPRRVFNLGLGGVMAAVGDVVIDCIVEQNRVLRHHTYHLMQRRLGDIADVLAINADGPARYIVKPEQQPPDG